MEIAKTLKELGQELKQLDLVLGEPSGKNGKFLKKDYVKVLSKYYVEKRYGSVKNMPVNLKFRYTFESPQLAEQYSKLKSDEQEKIWNSEDVWLVEKIFGVRGTMVYSPKEGYSCWSREISADDYIFVDYASRVLPDWIDARNITNPAAFDVEIVLANNITLEALRSYGIDAENDVIAISKLLQVEDETWNEIYKTFGQVFKLKLLDVYHYGGEDLRKKSYKDREKVFDYLVDAVRKSGIDISKPWIEKRPESKKAFHEGIMQKGGEGTIAVFVDKPCELTGRRKRDNWVKIKRSVFNMDEDAMDDTVDCWIGDVQYHKQLKDLVTSVTLMKEIDGEDVTVAEVDKIPLSLRISGELVKGVVCEVSGTRFVDNKIEEPLLEAVRHDRS